eukprot:378358-Rhodomonas_salina.1
MPSASLPARSSRPCRCGGRGATRRGGGQAKRGQEEEEEEEEGRLSHQPPPPSGSFPGKHTGEVCMER